VEVVGRNECNLEKQTCNRAENIRADLMSFD